MRELLRTNDPVLLSLVSSLLGEAGFVYLVADQNVSSVEGSIGIFPRRVLVASGQWDEANRLLHDAGLGEHCPRPGEGQS